MGDGDNNHCQYVDDYLYSKKMEAEEKDKDKENRGLQLLEAIKSKDGKSEARRI